MRNVVVYLLTGSLFAVSMAIAADPQAAARGVREIVAHRGSSVDRPECTLASVRRALEVGATAVEVDVRRTSDKQLVILHDATLDRTTNGRGPVDAATLAEVRRLDAGSFFDAQYADEKVPTLAEVLETCRGKIDVLLDLKEQGDDYARQVAGEVEKYGEPARVIVGVRSVAQARQFRELLPKSRQIGLIPRADDIEAFAEAGVETIRLWPHWLMDETLVPRVRAAKTKLHLSAAAGTPTEVRPLLEHKPESMSSDDPGRLLQTLRAILAAHGN